MTVRILFICFLLLKSPGFLFAQFQAYELQIESDSDVDRLLNLDNGLYSDSISLQLELRNLILELQDQLYFEASIDELNWKDSTAVAQLHLGKKYKGFDISYAGSDQEIMRFTKLNKLNDFKSRLLEEKLNAGFPFCMIKFDQLHFEGDVLEAELLVIENERVRFDEIIILGEAELSENFLENFLDIKKGEYYNHALVNDVNRKLKQLSFLQVKSEPRLLFDKDGVDVYLFVEKRKASRFDLLLGLLPVNDPLLDQSLIVTSLGLIDLHNVFENGENIYAKFEQLKPLTQELELKFTWPFLFDSPFGLKSSGSFYKQDTSFIELEYELGVRFFLKGSDYIEAFLKSENTNVLNINESQIVNSKNLPGILDSRNTSFGIGLSFNNLDYLYNPRKGYLINAKFSFGKKRIPQNNDILELIDPFEPAFDFAILYENISVEQDQFEYELDATYFFEIARSSTIKTSLRVGGIFSSGAILSNEQFRLGGARLLRGFNEQSFFVDEYYLGSLEYRLILNRNTFAFAFADFALLEDGSLMGTGSKRPLGFGAGFSFDTNTGIFNISLALGRDLINPDDFFDIGEPKLHFGYVSLF